jgi:hypothetical protein
MSRIRSYTPSPRPHPQGIRIRREIEALGKLLPIVSVIREAI